jgi:hypothetical protein
MFLLPSSYTESHTESHTCRTQVVRHHRRRDRSRSRPHAPLSSAPIRSPSLPAAEHLLLGRPRSTHAQPAHLAPEDTTRTLPAAATAARRGYGMPRGWGHQMHTRVRTRAWHRGSLSEVSRFSVPVQEESCGGRGRGRDGGGWRRRRDVLTRRRAPPRDKRPDGRQPLDLLVLARRAQQQRPLRSHDLERVLPVRVALAAAVAVAVAGLAGRHRRRRRRDPRRCEWRAARAMPMLVEVDLQRVKDLRDGDLPMDFYVLFFFSH